MRISDWSSDVCSSDLAQLGPWQDYMSLWQATTSRILGGKPEPVAAPERSDRRFRDEAWESSYLFDYIKQTYLLTARRSEEGSVGKGCVSTWRSRWSQYH